MTPEFDVALSPGYESLSEYGTPTGSDVFDLEPDRTLATVAEQVAQLEVALRRSSTGSLSDG